MDRSTRDLGGKTKMNGFKRPYQLIQRRMSVPVYYPTPFEANVDRWTEVARAVGTRNPDRELPFAGSPSSADRMSRAIVSFSGPKR